MQNFKVSTVNMELTGKNIARLRGNAGISVLDLSELMGFTGPQAVYKWQHGQTLPSVDNLVILSQIFHTSIDSILVLNEGQDVVFICSIHQYGFW